ncbi:class I glutamine amidotransferase-like protein [Mycena epipterygia]|nr:class I glutamine amidotransferase-like protein [Mycena epipterygia]
MPETLSIAVCISEGLTLPDFITPIPYRVMIDYLAPSMDPVVSDKDREAPTFNPTLTYADTITSGKQSDILWVPAGAGPDFVTGESRMPEEQIQFIARQARKAKYVVSVCAGAFQLALAGVFSGKRATTNKLFFRTVVAATPKDIEWVPMARWVIDSNLWTSSGITAGSDMALAFVEHLTSPKVARHIRGEYEIKEVKEKGDPFAAIHGLV